MLYRLAADGVLVLHLAFIAFALFGAVLAAHWRWVPLLQLPTVAWGAFVELSGRVCPLTYAENFLRVKAGLSGYAESFIEHYLLAIIYPAGLTRDTQLLLAGFVITVNAAIYAWIFLRWRRSGQSGA